MASALSVLMGAMIIAGTAIGAGMLANPTATSGVWFLGSLVVLLYVWLCMSLSGLMLLEARMRFSTGASFHSMVKQLLGNYWNVISSLSLVFVLYTLTYAYIFVGGGLTQELINQAPLLPDLSRSLAAVIFLFVIAVFVIASTHWVGRLSTVLIGTMVVCFLLAVTGVFPHVSFDVLLNAEAAPFYGKYAWLALPVCLASFGFHGNVPGLVDYHQGHAKSIAQSIWLGSGFALVLYVLWQLAVQGTLPRSAFGPVIAADGDVAVLLSAMSGYLSTAGMGRWLHGFAYFAIVSSCLGVTLGLFDYIRDAFGFSRQMSGRLKAASLTFLPPLLAFLVMPTGFVKVMGYVGLMASIWAVLVPVLLVRASRNLNAEAPSYRAPGGQFGLYFVAAFAVLVMAVQFLLLVGKLPVYRG